MLTGLSMETVIFFYKNTSYDPKIIAPILYLDLGLGHVETLLAFLENIKPVVVSFCYFSF